MEIVNCELASAHNLRTAPGHKNVVLKYINALRGALKNRVGSCSAVVCHPNIP